MLSYVHSAPHTQRALYLKRDGQPPFTSLLLARTNAVKSTEEGTLVGDAYDDKTNVIDYSVRAPLRNTEGYIRG